MGYYTCIVLSINHTEMFKQEEVRELKRSFEGLCHGVYPATKKIGCREIAVSKFPSSFLKKGGKLCLV